MVLEMAVNPFFIVGPTAVGKTDLAVELAERCGAEIISADAFQIYEGFDLLTAKPSAEQRRRVAHHLVGEIPASESYDVARYLVAARRILADSSQKRPVIVVGGSGLYVKALTHGLAQLPGANPEVREKLERLGLDELLALLRSHDPVAAITIDARNRRRLVRAVEVCLLSGKPFSSFRTQWEKSDPAGLRGIFLYRDRDELSGRIDQRVDRMFSLGVTAEAQAVPPDLSATAERMLGLAEVQAHVAGRLSLQNCKDQIAVATRRYAKRQVTWFKRECCFEAVNASSLSDTQVLQRAQRSYAAWRTAQSTEFPP